MNQPPPPLKPDDAEIEDAAGTNLPKRFECPTCGDHFPSQETLDEHLPEHKIA
jgi:hypothetical protein